MAVLVVSYPILVHLSVLLHQPLLQWLSLVVLCAVPQYAGLKAGRPRAWLLLGLLGALLLIVTRLGGGLYALFLPPIVLPAMLLILFGGSLRRGREPLITRMARATRTELPADLERYSRQVTVLWVVVLAAQVALAAGLALFASAETWSWYTNVASYVVIGAVFAIEYGWRRWRFRHLAHPGVVEYVRLLVRTDYRAL
ncbi:MAG TPA: hypothetical protein VJM11_11860 [Nevskiaceae bacterium]|nr:hypothetical protein [Nevskiaceae bacterium]